MSEQRLQSRCNPAMRFPDICGCSRRTHTPHCAPNPCLCDLVRRSSSIPAHGPVHLLQIRSHAQKHFQKLIKNGQRHEVPDARAKRPVSPCFKPAMVSLTL